MICKSSRKQSLKGDIGMRKLLLMLCIMIFTVGTSDIFALTSTGNLLRNGDAETGTTAEWTHSDDFMAVSSQSQTTGTVFPHSGDFFFDMAYMPSSYQYAYQDIDVSAYSMHIDTGDTFYDATFWFQNESWGQEGDTGQLTLSFYDGTGLLRQDTTGELRHTDGNYWTLEGLSNDVPVGTTLIQYQFEGFLHSGIYVNAFFDDAAFSISYEETVIPEPSTLFLLCVGGFGLLGFTRKLKK
jgi:hypothetical protein